jgi:5-oxoprolinase (ATP-hydrolysing)
MIAATSYRLGFDIGGTFTDFVLLNETSGALRLHKVLTTPDNPAVGSLTGIREITAAEGIDLSAVRDIVHGTTLVTNAIIERKGAIVGLLTTEGFRDIVEMGTEQRYDIYDLFLDFPKTLVPRSRRVEVSERIDALGRVVAPLDERRLLSAVEGLVADGVEAVAICFLHAYRNSDHERRARDIITRRFPRLYVSLSSEVVPEISEYQRAVTTVANTFVQPKIDLYLAELESILAGAGFAGDFLLMHSAGGLMSVESARRFPIRLLESGPAGGALATALFAQLAGMSDAIAFDMGGTTAKSCLIENGRAEIAPMMEAARLHRFKKGSGIPIKAPTVDMIEIGAGGGSIASVDELGLLKVGPESAGAHPGPAAYGRGGALPTVTDANVVLGYYDPGFFLGGRMDLDVKAAQTAVATLGNSLGLDSVGAAWGIFKLVSESMASATRVHLVEKGRDPRAYGMVAFGGAGPAFAASVARILGVRKVVIPPASGAASALGFLTAPMSFEQVRSLPCVLDASFDPGPIEQLLAELESEGRAHLETAGASDNAVIVKRRVDMRLVGQLHQVPVEIPAGKIEGDLLAQIRDSFAATYTARYTQSIDSDAVLEVLSFRVVCSGLVPKIRLDRAGAASGRSLKRRRDAWFGDAWLEAEVHDRYRLQEGDRIAGPAIIEERESTTVVPPGDSIEVDAIGNLVIAVAAPMRRHLTETRGAEAEEIAAIESDPIGLEIMWSRLVTIAEEMALTIMRTAYSLTISDAQDFGCTILDAKGEPLVHSPRTMPVFNQTLPRAARAALKHYEGNIEPGDVLITNDPWLCAGHLFDVAVITPIFFDGRMVAITGTVGHVTDIGGTKDWLRSREIYEEGIQIPPLKLVKDGILNEDVYRLIGENVRHSQQVLGDIRSFVSANATGGAHLIEFMREYGLHDLVPLASVVQSRAERAMRDRIREIPDGVYKAEIFNNPLGTPLRYPIKITVAGDAIEVDFEGAPSQQPFGGINCTMNYTMGHSVYPLKCLLTPSVRGNGGCIRPITIKAPKGSILNCEKPASVAVRTRTGWYIAPNIFRALAAAMPESAQAPSGLPVPLMVYGETPDGKVFSDMLLLGAGQGASARADGHSAIIYPSSAATPSIEMFETRVPMLVIEKSFVPDSGGAGKTRGGLSTRVQLRKLEDDGMEAQVSLYPEGVDLPVTGLFGGKCGQEGRGLVRNLATGKVHDVGTGELVSIRHTYEVVDLIVTGGAGFGDPAERDRAAVRHDLAAGYITAEGAAHNYGFHSQADKQRDRAVTV